MESHREEICRIRTHFQSKLQLSTLHCQSDNSKTYNRKSLKSIKKFQIQNPSWESDCQFSSEIWIIFWKFFVMNFAHCFVGAYHFAVIFLIRGRFEGLIFFIVSLDELIAVFKLFPARKMSSGRRRNCS